VPAGRGSLDVELAGDQHYRCEHHRKHCRRELVKLIHGAVIGGETASFRSIRQCKKIQLMKLALS
jgi:uncharacterized protein YuzB (UPF0349 family)